MGIVMRGKATIKICGGSFKIQDNETQRLKPPTNLSITGNSVIFTEAIGATSYEVWANGEIKIGESSGESSKLAKPTYLDVNGYILSFISVPNAQEYKIFIDNSEYGVSAGTIQDSRVKIDISQFEKWAELLSGDHTIKIIAQAEGYTDSDESESTIIHKKYVYTVQISVENVQLNKTVDTLAEYESVTIEINSVDGFALPDSLLISNVGHTYTVSDDKNSATLYLVNPSGDVSFGIKGIQRLTTPTNIEYDGDASITFDLSPNAEQYIVYLDGEEFGTAEPTII